MAGRPEILRLPNWILISAACLASLVCLAAFSMFKLPLAVILTGGSVFLLVALIRPSVALALLCAVLPVEGITMSSLDVTEVRLVGIGAFAIWMAHLLIHGKRVRFNRTFLLGLALLAWAGLSITWAVRVETTGMHYFTLVQSILLFLLVINVVENETDFRIVLAGFLLGALISSPLALNVFVQNVIERARVYEAQNPNGYSMVIGFAIISGLYLARVLKSFWPRVLIFLGSLFLVVPLVLAQSRSGWLATGTAVCVMVWYTRHRIRNYLLITTLAVSLVAGLFAVGMVNFGLIDRAYGLVTLRDQGSSRLDVWRVAGNIFADNPLLGVGFNQFPNTFNQYRPDTPSIRRDQIPSRDPHNTYVAVATETGLIGITLLLLMMYSACREEKIPPERKPWISDTMVVYVAVFSIGGTMLLLKLFWVALALASKARAMAAGDNFDMEAAG